MDRGGFCGSPSRGRVKRVLGHPPPLFHNIQPEPRISAAELRGDVCGTRQGKHRDKHAAPAATPNPATTNPPAVTSKPPTAPPHHYNHAHAPDHCLTDMVRTRLACFAPLSTHHQRCILPAINRPTRRFRADITVSHVACDVNGAPP